MVRYPVVSLGQQTAAPAGELIVIDRAVAEGTKLAIDLLDVAMPGSSHPRK